MQSRWTSFGISLLVGVGFGVLVLIVNLAFGAALRQNLAAGLAALLLAVIGVLCAIAAGAIVARLTDLLWACMVAGLLTQVITTLVYAIQSLLTFMHVNAIFPGSQGFGKEAAFAVGLLFALLSSLVIGALSGAVGGFLGARRTEKE